MRDGAASYSPLREHMDRLAAYEMPGVPFRRLTEMVSEPGVLATKCGFVTYESPGPAGGFVVNDNGNSYGPVEVTLPSGNSLTRGAVCACELLPREEVDTDPWLDFHGDNFEFVRNVIIKRDREVLLMCGADAY